MHRRDALLALFWPALDQARARAALRQALHALRRRLPRSPLVRRGDGEVGVDPALLRTDVEAFERALEAEDHEEAMRVYGGDFLRGFFLSGCPEFERWLDTERLRLRELAASAAWTLAGHQLRRGDSIAADMAARRAVELDPTAEGALRSFLEELCEAGDGAAAMRLYRWFERLLREDFQVIPSEATRAVAQGLMARGFGPDGPGRVASTGPGRSQEAPRPSLAVLPFASFGGEPDSALFGLGLTDDLLCRLSQIRSLRVVSRVSAIRYREVGKAIPEIAAELGVGAVLDGSVRRQGSRLRIVARLVEGGTGAHLWAETYDRRAEDLFLVQSEVAESIASALAAEMSEEQRAWLQRVPTASLEAWDAYLHGVTALQGMAPGELEEAAGHLRSAIRMDPGFSRAWALLAQVIVLSSPTARAPPSEYFPRARAAAGRALELSQRCAGAHAAMGLVKLLHDWDAAGAGEDLARAHDLDPGDAQTLGWRGILAALEGRAGEAVDDAREAVALDPLSPAAHVALGQVLVLADRAEEAAGVLGSALRLWPAALHLHLWMGTAYLALREADGALQHFDAASRFSGELPHFQALRAPALTSLGRRVEAKEILRHLQDRSRSEYVDPYGLFTASLAVGGHDAALPHLEAMWRERSIFLPYLRALPGFGSLLREPGFSAVMERAWPGSPSVHMATRERGGRKGPSPGGARDPTRPPRRGRTALQRRTERDR